MNQGKLVFAQIMEHLPLTTFRRCVARYDGEHKVKHFSCLGAPFRSTKAAVKLHTLLDLRGSIPSFIFISDGKFHDVNVLDHLVPEPVPSTLWTEPISTSSDWPG
jgi:hypothetical protein